jgi:hypothetical protein
MQVQIQVFEPGTRVEVKEPAEGLRGVWIVHTRIVEAGLQDALYDLFHSRSGRHVEARRSRLKLSKEDSNGG